MPDTDGGTPPDVRARTRTVDGAHPASPSERWQRSSPSSDSVRGFRWWRLSGNAELLSPWRGPVCWRPGENEASCLARRGIFGWKTSRAPHPRGCPATGCECGFYALHSLPELNGGLDRAIWEIDTATSGGRHGLVLGVVAGSGRVLIGTEGWRVPIPAGSSPCSPAPRSRATPARWGSPRPPTGCPCTATSTRSCPMGAGPGRGRLPDGLRPPSSRRYAWRLDHEEACVPHRPTTDPRHLVARRRHRTGGDRRRQADRRGGRSSRSTGRSARPAPRSSRRASPRAFPTRRSSSLSRTRVMLKGPLETPVGFGEKSANVTLRKLFETYANVRPGPGAPGREDPVQRARHRPRDGPGERRGPLRRDRVHADARASPRRSS